MGLDMYLTGRKHIPQWGNHSERNRHEDGLPIEQIEVAIGYWRKHPNLHGYIVENFGPKDENDIAKDDCNEIDLDLDQLEQLRQAIVNDELPMTEGFFFGESPIPDEEGYAEQKEEDLEIIARAMGWLVNFVRQDGVWRRVYYRASW